MIPPLGLRERAFKFITALACLIQRDTPADDYGAVCSDSPRRYIAGLFVSPFEPSDFLLSHRLSPSFSVFVFISQSRYLIQVSQLRDLAILITRAGRGLKIQAAPADRNSGMEHIVQQL